MIVAFIDAFRHVFGVQAICRALSSHHVPVAPRTYWAARSRPPSRRALRDALVTQWLAVMFEPDQHGRRRPESLYGAVKAWAHLNRQGLRVARCTVERLMRANGWRGNTRRRKVRTTVPDPGNPRFPDLVRRDFRADAPGRLLVADFTYVPLAAGGFAYVAFVTGAFAGTIRGWECSLSKETRFVQRAIAQAAAQLRRLGHPVGDGAVHHADAGSQYTSVRFAQTLMLQGLAGSTGSVGDAYDNALAETTIGLYKSECTRDGSPFRDGPLTTRGDVEKITAAWVHKALLGIRFEIKVSVVGSDGHHEVLQEALIPGEAEGVRPGIADPDGRVSGELLIAVFHREPDADHVSHRPPAGDPEFFGQGAVKLYPGERCEPSAHASPQCTGVQQAFHRRSQEPFKRNIYNRPGCKVAVACGGERPKLEPHCGAAPTTASSESVTRNIDCARWPCRVSQVTTS